MIFSGFQNVKFSELSVASLIPPAVFWSPVAAPLSNDAPAVLNLKPVTPMVTDIEHW